VPFSYNKGKLSEVKRTRLTGHVIRVNETETACRIYVNVIREGIACEMYINRTIISKRINGLFNI
jgi:hypothetical protein